MPLPPLQLVCTTLPPDITRSVMAREAALWVGAGHDHTPKGAADLARLIQLPWQLVLAESSRGSMAKAVEASVTTSDRFARTRGFVHLIAENPAELVRSPRSLPVFLLNGRDDATEAAASAALKGHKAALRRLSMLEELRKARPQVLVVLADPAGGVLDEVFALWGDDGFTPRVVVIDPADACGPRVDAWLATGPKTAAVVRCVLPAGRAATDLLAQAEAALPDGRRVVRLLRDGGRTVDVDVTECEPVEFPLYDRYELLHTQHLGSVLPDDLTDDQINRFFAGTTDPDAGGGDGGWAAYAAGLPWPGRTDILDVTLRGLDECLRYGSERNHLILVPCEPGAGGTTLARATAFAAARKGFPALLARDLSFRPDAGEMARFLTRVSVAAREATKEVEAEADETPWLLVFDVAHWRGREADAVAFVRELSQGGRAVVLLCVVEEVAEAFYRWRREAADPIRHDISQEEAVSLGRHLNRFLTPRNRGVPEHDWVAFWQKHSPGEQAGPASFWVALSFWLRKQLDLSDTIQGMIAGQITKAVVPAEAWPLVYEVAAMSVERESTPEGVLAPPPNVLARDLLHDLRKQVPALGLQPVGGSADRSWYLSHDLLGRLLLNSLFYNRAELARLGLGDARDAIHLRILLLRRVAGRPALTRRTCQALALEFPVNILKLDDARLEFAPYWSDVLAALDDMPSAFRENSRTFKHHVSISRRRVAVITQFFDITPNERVRLLEEAVELLEEALDLPPNGQDDESDLNLYNSLSLAYQNLANAEKDRGAGDGRLTDLWRRASEAAQEAKRLNPRNSYVLETLARNLILTAKLYPEHGAEKVAEALGYVYQAMTLEKAGERQRQLLKYAQEAVDVLRTPSGTGQAIRLAAAGNPFGHLALAWVHLTGGKPNDPLVSSSLKAFPPDRVRLALNQLSAVTDPNPLVLQLRYDLTVAADEWAFDKQLEILDQLALSLPHMPLQLRLERAILLHQLNRHQEANEEYQEVRRATRLPANQEFVVVPRHLEWLAVRQPGKVVKRVCAARLTGKKGENRNWAKVVELLNAEVPYNPREFPANLVVGQGLKCYLSFGYNGPLLKPVVGGEGLS